MLKNKPPKMLLIFFKQKKISVVREKRCGHVAILRAPNAGKSTLLNALIGQKIAISSPKIQTTRNKILGVSQVQNTQIIFWIRPELFLLPTVDWKDPCFGKLGLPRKMLI